ncbi:DUF3849 domain-containing protein [bacterium]|nr:DUF3849 domain-containing protein [bacterium]MDY3021856.1 DUF3849 domain-containing protein [Oliverpabstia sp.]
MAGKRDQQMKEITERLEQGVKELFTSEMYTEYLKTMSQFHNYSFNNTLLIAMQKPDATLVAGYQAWQKKFKRQVKRGEKGIQIIAPAPIREKEEVEMFDPETNEPILRPDGQPETEEVVHTIPRFRVTTVFDVSQTYGEPLPGLETPELMGSVENFETFMQAIGEVSPVPIRFDDIESGAKGFYSNANKEIVIQNGMSESQTMKTAVHEVTHAKLHDRDMMEELGEKKNQMTREVEAESVAYTVCQYFGLDTSDYSFPYIAGWSSSMEMKELRASMDTIRKTAGEFIDQVVEKFHEIKRQKIAERDIRMDDLILCISGSMGSEYEYCVIENMTAGQLEECVRDYVRLVVEDAFLENKVSLEDYLTERGACVFPVYASDGLGEEYPVDFFDVEYDVDTGITVFSELSAQKQAEMLIAKVEYKETIFNEEEKNLITNYAYKFDNIEGTRSLVEDIMQAHEHSDARIIFRVMEAAQEEIDSLPDGMIGFSEMHRYGYQRDDVMLPLEKERAHELYQEGFEIFALYPDDTEVALEDEMEIDAHDGLFGVETGQWEKHLAAEKEKELFVNNKEYQQAELFDVPVLFANERVDLSGLPEGIYRYELRGADYDPGYPLTVENSVTVNHAATILTAVPLEIPEQGYLWLGDELNFTGGMQSIGEYQQEMFALNLESEQEIAENAMGRSNENLYLSGQDDRYTIYQIVDSTKGREYAFMSMDFVTSHDMTVDAADYHYVYGGRLSEGVTLDSLYEKFNLNHPENYTGHSLSVSDVIVLQKESETKAYYVDSFGFQELPDFVRQRLHEAKMNRKREDSRVTLDTSGIEIEQHEGLWHTVDKMEIQDDIFYLMKHNEYGDSVVGVIVNADGELVAQELENGFDRGAMEAIQEYFAGKGITWEPEVIEETAEENIYPPVYPHTLAYAMEHAEADDYLDSRRLNIACKNAVEEAINYGFDGMHLANDVVEPVLKEYGQERLSYVLACTLQYKSWDGRFSRENKAWAESIPVEENVNRGVDVNTDYVVDSHPAVLDGFVNLARKRFTELEQAQEQETPFIAQYYVVNDAYGVKAEREYQYFADLQDALKAYHLLPNHLDKQIGMESTEQPPSRMALISCKNGLEEIEDINFNSLSGKWLNPETKAAQQSAEEYLASFDKEIAYWIEFSEKYLFVQTGTEGYDYTLYDKEYRELDGGVYDDPDLTIRGALEEILVDEERSSIEECEVIDCEKFLETVDRAEYFPQKSFEALKGLMNSGANKIAFKTGYGYASIQQVQDGYNSVVYDSDWREIGGKFYDVPDASMEEAVGWLFKDEDLAKLDCEPFAYDELEKHVLQAAKERLKENQITPTSQISIREASLNGQCRHDIEETVLCFAQAQIEEMGLSEEVRLLGARVYGSRTREGLYQETSDVDVVLSYTGNIREDAFFHILHENGMKIAGLPVDVNPISTEKTGTLEKFMEDAEKYLDDKELQQLASDIDQFSSEYDLYEYRDSVEHREENVRQIYSAFVSGQADSIQEWVAEIAADENDDLPEVVEEAKKLLARVKQALEKGRAEIVHEPEKVDAKITFYVAECMEFPVLGEYHDNMTLQEAIALYEKIPSERMNGVKGIGFCLEDGSIYDGEYELMSGDKISRDLIDLVPYYKDHPLVQRAISDLEEILSQKQQMIEKAVVSESSQEQPIKPEKTPEKEPDKDSSMSKGTGKKESVLKALRERQARLKEQNQDKDEQKSKEHKKGEQEL